MAEVNEVEQRALREDALCGVEAMHVQASSMSLPLSTPPNRPQEEKLGSFRARRGDQSRLLRAKLDPIVTGSGVEPEPRTSTTLHSNPSVARSTLTQFTDSSMGMGGPAEAEKGSLSRTSTKRSIDLADAYEIEKGSLSRASTKRSVVPADAPEPEKRPLSVVSLLSAKSPLRSVSMSRSAEAKGEVSPDRSPTRSMITVSPLEPEKPPSSSRSSTEFEKDLAALDDRPAADVHSVA